MLPRVIEIRQMTEGDIPSLKSIDANYESESYLDWHEEGEGFNREYILTEKSFDIPFVKRDYGIDDKGEAGLYRAINSQDELALVAEVEGQVAGYLHVALSDWRGVSVIWGIYVDRTARRMGIGHTLMRKAVEWSREKGLKAIYLETQTCNIAACRFYQKFGFVIGGIDPYYYVGTDIERQETAIFWYYFLD